MKIIILIDARQPGGVETHVMNLYEALIRRGQACKLVFVCRYPDNLLYSVCKARHIQYEDCRSIKELVALLNREKPDIIHAHGYKANIYARIYGLFTRTPVVTTFHAGEKPTGRLILYNFLDRWTSFLSGNIAVNAAIARRIPAKSTVIPNFVEVPASLSEPATKAPFQIYFIGRVNPEKDPLGFCELASQSPKEFAWHMAGTGPLLKECQEKYQNRVTFHGLINNMEDIWPKVDLLCITSFYEGLPLVLLEAMSRGIPVVSFDVGNISEVLAQPELIVKDHNLQNMQQCITDYFAKSEGERQQMATQARQRVETAFSREVVVSRIMDFYKQNLLGLDPTNF